MVKIVKKKKIPQTFKIRNQIRGLERQHGGDRAFALHTEGQWFESQHAILFQLKEKVEKKLNKFESTLALIQKRQFLVLKEMFTWLTAFVLQFQNLQTFSQWVPFLPEAVLVVQQLWSFFLSKLITKAKENLII